MIYGIKSRYTSLANTRILFCGYEISIAMDDSCGVLQDLARVDIRVFDRNNEDVTDQFRYPLGTAAGLYALMQEISKKGESGKW